MATASITISDDESGQVTVSADFGDKLEETSQAHAMIYTLLQSVLGTAKNYTAVEDTAGDFNGQSAEPNRIITSEGAN
ncbi:hypothetical protein UFOVP653_19 [uncultured Caudovirales phage]|uniref:Uncharacterized protein n=1 Tax=uncultured Caudovirales phage TaxID=2100421 RepID=A0A6J5N6D9_9CAUD|nr:hypothetical protein UFOVP653_19 [uncultured Caudovirales phage]